MYLNVLIVYLNESMNVFIAYLKICIVYLNVFEFIQMYS
jgi:hypothetical protein